jgi:UDP-N-acetylmuramate--alanine ligase
MNLFLQSDSRPIHFVGIGGAGMSALALVALRRGIRVTGSDTDISGTSDLVSHGATVFAEAAGSTVGEARAVVVSAAVAPQHPDLVEARQRGLPIVPRKEALAGLIGDATCVAIAGTHGKTTTTVMTTEALTGAGFAPTGLAGGRVAEWGGNAKLASDRLFVVEADEFDQAFLSLRPTVAVINNVEADHLECYGSLAAMEAAYVRFASTSERVIVGDEGAGADRVAEALAPNPVWRFGPNGPDIRLSGIRLEPLSSRSRVTFPDGAAVDLVLALPGLHNLRNGAAALAVTTALGGDLAGAARALAAFHGVGRRFERVGERGEVMVIDDYAHHPTELSATLRAARQAFPSRRLVAVFQPHLFSRTALHGAAMGEALTGADLSIVTDVYRAREEPVAGVTGALVAEAARRGGAAVIYHPDRASLGRVVAGQLKPGDVLLTMGAGDITHLGREVLGLMAGERGSGGGDGGGSVP